MPADVSHKEELLKQLDIETSLGETYQKDLQVMLEEFHNIFALDSTELGCTKLVQHAIDTGDHPPIRQLPHRTPFALRGKQKS